MFKKIIILTAALLFFSIIGCEKKPELDLPATLENKEVLEQLPIEEKVDVSTLPKHPEKLKPKIEKKSVQTTEQEEKIKITQPIMPTFSKELLQAVSNWEKVPKGVFPLKSVQVTEGVILEAKTQNGKIIAKSVAEKGSKVTVLGMDGDKLVVSSPNSTKLRGVIEIEKTDFKQMVSYLFEYRKKQRERLKEDAESRKLVKNNQEVPPPTTPKTEDSDFIVDPLDFGHGRFCICKDCREKRLAQSGSERTGFGIEP